MPESSSQPGSQDDSYVVVARRYRPKEFEQLVGQDHVGQALKNAIETGRVGHAYLFTGARGVGKTSTARIFAKALNDPGGPTGTPDAASDVALAIDAGEDVDVIEIDGASNRGIDEIRSLRANVGVRPSRSRFKIYIIDEVHMLTQAAFNALLKTLEEPPEHVKFIFCTTDPEKIPITVLSRCQRFDFAPVEVKKIVGRLREICDSEQAKADDSALELIARRAAGSMRDSQSLLEQVISFSGGELTAQMVHQMLGTADDERLHQLAKTLAANDAAGALQLLDAAIDAGVDAGRLAEQLLGYFRDLLAVTVGCEVSMQRHTSASLHAELKELGDRWGLQTVLAVVGLVDETLVRIRHSVYARVLLESTVIQICHLPDLQALADLTSAAASLPDGAKLTASEKKKAEPGIASSGAKAVAQASQQASPKIQPSTPTASQDSPSRPDLRIDAPQSDSVKPTPTPPVTAGVEAKRGVGATRLASASAGQATSPDHLKPTVGVSTDGGVDPVKFDVQDVWNRALEKMDPMTATLVRSVSCVEQISPGQLQLTFPAEAGLARNRCDKPEHRQEIVETLRRVCDVDYQLVMHSAAPVATTAKPAEKQSGKSRVQRMREIETNSLVVACKEIFRAEVTKIDMPR